MTGWARRLLDTGMVAIGESDCELLHDGTLVQPVNAVTSCAYVAMGIVAVVWATRLRHRRTEPVMFGVLLAGIGIGSVLFHGPQPAGSKALHDLPILLLGLLMLLHDLALLRPTIRTLPAFAVAAPIVTIVGLLVPAIVPTLSGVVIIGVVVLEFLIQRRGARPVPRQVALRAYLAMAVLGALGGLSYALGRTGAALCDPDGIVQLHGLWHLLSGLVFGVWWWLAYAAGDRR